jgi:hypothetical protein
VVHAIVVAAITLALDFAGISGGAAGEKIPTLGEKIARHTKPNEFF